MRVISLVSMQAEALYEGELLPCKRCRATQEAKFAKLSRKDACYGREIMTSAAIHHRSLLCQFNLRRAEARPGAPSAKSLANLVQLKPGFRHDHNVWVRLHHLGK